MAKLGRSVNELERDLLEERTGRVHVQRLAQSHHTLLRPNHAPFHEQEVIDHLAIVREATHRGDALVRQVILGSRIVLDDLVVHGVDSFSDPVDLLVLLGTVMVPELTGTGHSEPDTGRMP